MTNLEYEHSFNVEDISPYIEFCKKNKMKYQSVPLAERLRPTSLDQYIGQEHLVGENAVLRRAIESGRYVTRSASTGISTIISPRGEVLKHIEPDTEGVIVYDVNFRQNRTLWFYLGNSFIYLCVMICVFLAVHQIVVFIKTKKQKSIDFVMEL